MKFKRFSTWLSLSSLFFLFVVLLSPDEYSVLRWHHLVLQTGRLFPFILISWISSFIAVALNFVYAERALFLDNISLPGKKKWVPSFLSIPALASFLWFISQIFIGPY